MKTLRTVRRVGGVEIERREAGMITDHRASPIHVPREPLPEPTVAEMLHNFAGAMAEWYKQGFSIVPRETYTARLIACRSCPGRHWDESARLGAGKCNHPSCGCTKAKLWLGTSTCPIKHWPV
jgi:hypothetical protein